MLGFLLISSISFVTADPGNDYKGDDDHDEVEDEYEYEEEREVEVDVESDKVEITSVSKNKDVQNKFEVDVELSNYVEVSVGFSSEIETNSTETESEFQFKVEFKKIIEFVDLNNNSIYEGDVIDNFVQEYEFASFKPIEYTTEVLPSNNTLHSLLISTTDDVFKVHLYVVEEFEIVNGTLVTPLEVKMDIEFTNFNYLEENSQLALYVMLESEYEYQYEADTHDEGEGWGEDEEGFNTDLNGENGFFTWENFALVDGVEMPVEFTPIADDDDNHEEDKIYFNYARGSSIYHDPKIGFAVLTTANPTNWLTIGLIAGGSIAAVVIVGLIVVGERKRR